jgi:hypothetical protein
MADLIVESILRNQMEIESRTREFIKTTLEVNLELQFLALEGRIKESIMDILRPVKTSTSTAPSTAESHSHDDMKPLMSISPTEDPLLKIRSGSVEDQHDSVSKEQFTMQSLVPSPAFSSERNEKSVHFVSLNLQRVDASCLDRTDAVSLCDSPTSTEENKNSIDLSGGDAIEKHALPISGTSQEVLFRRGLYLEESHSRTFLDMSTHSDDEEDDLPGSGSFSSSLSRLRRKTRAYSIRRTLYYALGVVPANLARGEAGFYAIHPMSPFFACVPLAIRPCCCAPGDTGRMPRQLPPPASHANTRSHRAPRASRPPPSSAPTRAWSSAAIARETARAVFPTNHSAN